MNKISALILAKNEEKKIGDCITSLSFADEVIVIDDFSTDRTKDIAESLGARVIQHALEGDYGKQRRFAIEQASGNWILFLDADERISNELAHEICNDINLDEKYSYWIRRKNKFNKKDVTHGVLRPEYVNRLLPKEGATSEGVVHESIQSVYPRRNLKHYIDHYTYDNWDQYFNKFNNYTRLGAVRREEEGKTCSFFPDIVLRPIWAFIKSYIIDRGFLDGKIGWILSVNNYFYTMTKYVRLYYLYEENKKKK